MEEIEEVAVSVCVASSIEAGARAVTACDDDNRIAIAVEEERKPCIYSIIVCIIMHPGRPPMDVAVVLAFASQLIQSRINNRSLVCMYVCTVLPLPMPLMDGRYLGLISIEN